MAGKRRSYACARRRRRDAPRLLGPLAAPPGMLSATAAHCGALQEAEVVLEESGAYEQGPEAVSATRCVHLPLRLGGLGLRRRPCCRARPW